MADALPLAVFGPSRSRHACVSWSGWLMLSAALASAPASAAESFGALTVARGDGPTRGLPVGATRAEVSLRWRSSDGRFSIALVDNGISLRTALAGYDATGRARCNSIGPLLVYDSADWMDLRWRTLIEEQGNFLRTCHVIDQRAARKYRGQFLRDAASFPVALASFRSEVREVFGPARARCLDFRDGSDIAVAGRDRCEQMVER